MEWSGAVWPVRNSKTSGRGFESLPPCFLVMLGYHPTPVPVDAVSPPTQPCGPLLVPARLAPIA